MPLTTRTRVTTWIPSAIPRLLSLLLLMPSAMPRPRNAKRLCYVIAAAAAITLSAAHAGNAAATPNSDLAMLGKQIFFDASLSATGHLSCASCHSPQHAYGPPNALAVQQGGAGMDRQGIRAVPSLRYVLNRTPIWNKPFVANAAERILEGDEPPRGGFGWDGRFNTLHEQ